MCRCQGFVTDQATLGLLPENGITKKIPGEKSASIVVVAVLSSHLNYILYLYTIPQLSTYLLLLP
jgi:hypothetical protein